VLISKINSNQILQQNPNEKKVLLERNELNQSYHQIDMFSKHLNEMSVLDLCEYIDLNEMMKSDFKQVYKTTIKECNLNGRVLSFCDLNELKDILKMSFGDWQLFKNWIQIKRVENDQKL